MSIVDDLIARARGEARPCLSLQPAGMDAFSQIGGAPMLPAECDWPTWNDQPLSFLVQIDLAEAPKDDWPEWMPPDGRLFFFYDPEQSTWGFDPKDRGSWAVRYAEPGAACVAHPAPAGVPDRVRFKAKPVRLAPALSVPSYERLDTSRKRLPDAESKSFWERFDELERDLAGTDPRHRMFGWPSPVQGDKMELECQLASHGVDCGRPSAFKGARAKALAAGAGDWQLLLQLDTDDDARMMWGDTGMLYFWIRRQDAARKDFSNVWMILQCY